MSDPDHPREEFKNFYVDAIDLLLVLEAIVDLQESLFVLAESGLKTLEQEKFSAKLQKTHKTIKNIADQIKKKGRQ